MSIDDDAPVLLDDRRRDFFIVDNDVIRKHGAALGPYGIAVYCALVMYANADRKAWPSMTAIAASVGCSARQARAKVNQLAELGLVGIERRPTGNGLCHETNVYTILSVGVGTAPGAVGTARRAVGVRHTVQGGTAHGADKQDPVNKKETTTADESAWGELLDAVAETYGGIDARRSNGKPYAWAGKILGIAGKHTGDDPVAAVSLWRSWVATIDDRRFMPGKDKAAERFGAWCAGRNGGGAAANF